MRQIRRDIFRMPLWLCLIALVHCKGSALGYRPSILDLQSSGLLNNTPGNVDGSTTTAPNNSNTNSPMGATSPSEGLPPIQSCLQGNTALRILRRLTINEYNATLVSLFGSKIPQLSTFNDEPVQGFENNAQSLRINGALTQIIEQEAEAVASWAITNNALAPYQCQPVDANCFIEKLGTQIYRRPLNNNELASLRMVYDTEFNGDSNTALAQGQALSAMLQSPGFLYRSEVGDANPKNSTLYNLSAYEVASELSYLFTQTMPDSTLMQTAANGSLLTPKVLAVQAQRLMQQSASKNFMLPFFTQLFNLNQLSTVVRDPKLYPDWNNTVAQQMQTEFNAFVEGIVQESSATLKTLYTQANAAEATAGLSQFYDAAPTANGTAHRPAGILGLGAVLTVTSDPQHSSPTLRGKMVRERLFCEQMAPPPAAFMVSSPSSGTPTTTRQLYEQHSKNPTCNACHKMLDPIGFSFENYDAIGRYRASENGITIDANGTIEGIFPSDAAVHSIEDLSNQLAQSTQGKACIARNLMIYSFGVVSWPQDGCTLDALTADAENNNYNLQQLLLALTRLPSFTQRQNP